MRGETILLLGNYRPALAVARGLAPLGHRLIISADGGEGCCEYSRHIKERWDHPPLSADPGPFLRALLAYLRDCPEISLVFPISEPFVLCLAAATHLLPANVRIVSPNAETIRHCSDKLTMLALARQCDVPVLPFGVARTSQEFDRIAGEVGFPLVIRPLPPLERLHHRKAAILDSSSELDCFVREWAGHGRAFLLQRRAMGNRHNVYFVAQHGQMLASVETRILRTDHPEGTGLAVEGTTCLPTAALAQDCRRLLGELNYSGIGLAQFHLDPDNGERCLLEINPRIAGSQDIAERAGLEGARRAVELAMGMNLDPAVPVEIRKPGLRYCWTYGDLRGLRSAYARGDIGHRAAFRWLGQTALALCRCPYHMTWRLSDPLPTIMLFARLAFPRANTLGARSQSPLEEART